MNSFLLLYSICLCRKCSFGLPIPVGYQRRPLCTFRGFTCHKLQLIKYHRQRKFLPPLEVLHGMLIICFSWSVSVNGFYFNTFDSFVINFQIQLLDALYSLSNSHCKSFGSRAIIYHIRHLWRHLYQHKHSLYLYL